MFTTPIDREKLNRVGKKIAAIQDDQPYTGILKARTGRLNTDGTLNPNPTDGLPDGWIWVRESMDQGATYSRAAVPAHCAVRNDYADLPCFTGIDYEGYKTAFGSRVDEEAIAQLGAFTAAMSVPQAPSTLQNQVTQSALIDVGLVRPSDDDSFLLTVQANNGVWDETTVDVTAIHAAAAPGALGLGVVVYDPYAAAAFAIGATSLPYPDNTVGIGVSAFADIPLLPGAYPLAGVAIAYGTGEITKSVLAASGAAIIDLRLWLAPYQTGGWWIVNGTSAIPSGVSGVIPDGIRITDNGSLTVTGTLCVT